MKLIHLSDLHIGKRIKEISMLKDQSYILDQILQILDREEPDGVILAGDIYDKSIPSIEAVTLLDDFLFQMSQRHLHVFVISGNHDSPERIAFGSRLIDGCGIHLAPAYHGTVTPITLQDTYGEVEVFMLPFLKPVYVRQFYPDEEIQSYTDAVRTAISHMPVCPEKRNILITHQFVTGASRCESEEISVGGSDNVDADVFAEFDYVALGHIHNPQNVGMKTIRYCGTPLKYSFSEAGHTKSVTVLELKEKGTLEIRTIPLTPMRDMREIRGTYAGITLKKNYEGTNTEDYIHITLTDEEDIPNAMEKLRVIYPNLMRLDYDNQRTRYHTELNGIEEGKKRDPSALLDEFYEKQNGKKMNEKQREFSEKIMEEIWEDIL